ASDTAHIRTAEARRADLERIDWLEAGDHARVTARMPEFLKMGPGARFGHYLMMVAALGERTVTAPARPFSEYENSAGTGQVHLWFERPAGGWSRGSHNGESCWTAPLSKARGGEPTWSPGAGGRGARPEPGQLRRV